MQSKSKNQVDINKYLIQKEMLRQTPAEQFIARNIENQTSILKANSIAAIRESLVL